MTDLLPNDWVAAAVRFIRSYGKDDRAGLWMAEKALRRALRLANTLGYPPKAKAPIIRMLNWVRADIAKITKLERAA